MIKNAIKTMINIKSLTSAVILSLSLGMALPASASHRSHSTCKSHCVVRTSRPLFDGQETHGGPKKGGPLFDGQETHGGPK